MSIARLSPIYALFFLVHAGCGNSGSSDGMLLTGSGGQLATEVPMQSMSTPDMMVAQTNSGPDEPAPVKTIQASASEFAIPPLEQGRDHEAKIILSNTGNTRVEITKITLDNPTGGRIDVLYNPTGLVGIDQNGNDKFRYPLPIDTDVPLELRVYVVQGAAGMPGGTVTVNGDFEGSPLSLPIKSVAGLGALALSRTEIDFGRVRPGNPSFEALTGITGKKVETLTVTNTGPMTLNITGIELKKGGSGAEALDFVLALAGGDPIDEPSLYADPDGDGSPGLSPGAQFEIGITYEPTREGADRARILIDSDDPSNPEASVQLLGNEEQGCINVDPAMVSLDAMLGTTANSSPITISNCGMGPLTIDYLGFAAGTDDTIFKLINSPFSNFPAEIEPNGNGVQVAVEYSPNTGTISAGNLLIMSNDPATDKNLIIVRISGTAPCTSDEECAMGQMCGSDQRCFTPEMME